MCGIIGYVGKRDASSIVLDGLRKLEYRGYDSVGIAVEKDGHILVKKDIGNIESVDKKLNLSGPSSNLAMGHTRWATHGGVTKSNAHPHTGCNGSISVVHNGVIDNYRQIKKELESKGHIFKSETDTEVIPHLIEEELKNKDLEQACASAFQRLEGTFAILVMKTGAKEIIAVKKGSPLVIGIEKGGAFAASDIPAFANYTKEVVYLQDYDMVSLSQKPKYFHISKKKLIRVKRPVQSVNFRSYVAKKGIFEHFMLKEIVEQSNTVQSAITQDKKQVQSIANAMKKANGVFFIGCGTSYNACLASSYLFSKVARKHVNVVHASEFPNYKPFLSKDTLVIAVSQSGETYDVLNGIKAAKEAGSRVIAVTNAHNSSITVSSDTSLFLNSGIEVGVLATKTYTAQLALLALVAYAVAGKYDEGAKKMTYLGNIMYNMTSSTQRKTLKKISRELCKHDHILCIGRGIQYATALEAALKIKEVSYVHAEAFAGGELKHGPLALVEKGTPCIAFVSQETKEEILANIEEIKARGGYVIGVASEKCEVFDAWAKVEECELENPIAQIIPIQIIAYQMAVLKGLDPDKPRNLAKCVTVK